MRQDSKMTGLSAALALLCAHTACASDPAAASPTAVPTAVPAALTSAFAGDGFTATAAASYGGGLGVAAQSTTAFINGNASQPKPAYYVRGSAYEMGYLLGFLASARVASMTSTFLEHIVPALISEEADAALQNSTLAPVYDALCDALAALLEADTARYFAASVAAGAIPAPLVDEMRGLAAGAAQAAPAANVTYEKIVTMNFGYDMLLALIYTGEILDLLGAKALARGAPPAVAAALRALPRSYLRVPVLCNAAAVRGAASATGAPLFLRDFMFALGEVFQLHVSTTVYVPAEAGRLPLVALAAPGFVGAMAALNAAGFAMGVDVLQAALGNTSVVGLNSLLMVRAAAHAAADTPAATAYVAGAQRGVPWIYPMADAAGAGAVLETAPSGAPAGAPPPDWRPLVEDAALRALLPSPAQIAAALRGAREYDRGVFVRRIGVHARPEEALIPAWNPALFAKAAQPYPGGGAWGNGSAPGAAVFATFQAEEAAYSGGLAQRYFSPERGAGAHADDVIYATNLALAPELRIAAMTFWTSLDGMGAPQFRYDALVREVEAAMPLTLASAQHALSFQQRVPGYERDTVDGVLSVSDLRARVMTAKGGFWADQWTTVTLPRYL